VFICNEIRVDGFHTVFLDWFIILKYNCGLLTKTLQYYF
jgi:hypothetical protein